uniref:Uncharacterized protein n=1 Tax=Mycena chlorophos TaxID=658473 RepID=A0ABQ0LIL7_MYCCL|nr:predicted protein [Mycena chlorophos]
MVVDPILAQPQTLASSEPDAVFRQLLDEINPELAHIPLQFIQVQLAECFKPMIRGLSSVDRAALEDTSPYGPMGTIKLVDPNPSGNDDISSIHPTHLLAISSRDDTQSRPHLVPVHGIVFVAHCAKPRLGASAVVEGSEPNTFVLPITSLTLPSVSAFYALRAYMYNPHPLTLLNALLPGVLSNGLPPTPMDLSSHTTRRYFAAQVIDVAKKGLTASHPTEILPRVQAYAARMPDVWLCAWTLGMYRQHLWNTLDFVSGVVGCALKMLDAGSTGK